MKRKQWIAFLGMVSVVLIFAACGGDSGNNSTEPEGDSSSSTTSLVVSSSSVKVQSSASIPLSSSVEKVSSSSVVKFSSSSVGVLSSSSSLPPSSSSVLISYGSLTDTRDNQVYKTVVIGIQTWMAENLNYADSASMTNLMGNSWCYKNSADSCAKYGRLYTWTATMNIASSYQEALAAAVISTPQQGVCPAGWHIPTFNEWGILQIFVGYDVAGTMLKDTTGWDAYRGVSGNGTDSYGFSVLPGGYRRSNDYFSDVSLGAYFWSATEYDIKDAFNLSFNNIHKGIFTNSYYKGNAYSVRCVKD